MIQQKKSCPYCTPIPNNPDGLCIPPSAEFSAWKEPQSLIPIIKDPHETRTSMTTYTPHIPKQSPKCFCSRRYEQKYKINSSVESPCQISNQNLS